eukprot:g64875.t1
MKFRNEHSSASDVAAERRRFLHLLKVWLQEGGFHLQTDSISVQFPDILISSLGKDVWRAPSEAVHAVSVVPLLSYVLLRAMLAHIEQTACENQDV